MPPNQTDPPSGASERPFEPDPATVIKLGPRILSAAAFVRDWKPPAFLIDDLIQRGYLYSLTGQTGHGKTALSILIAFHVATGSTLGDKSVSQGRVIILAGENPDDIRARVILASEAYGVSLDSLDLHFVAGAFHIAKCQEALEREVERIGGADLIVVDTSAAFFQGVDENDNADAIHHARTLRTLSTLKGKPCILVPCHPTKHASKDNLLPRGGGAFIAEVDGNLTLWSSDGGETAELHHTKLRGPGFEPVNFRLEKRASGAVQDDKGRPMRSVVAWPMTEGEVQTSLQQSRSDEDAMLDMLLNRPSCSYAEWAEHLGWRSTITGRPNKSKVERALKRLNDDKLIKRHRGRWKFTPGGRKEADRVVRIS